MASDLTAARRTVLQESAAIGVSVVVGGILFGIAARDAGLTAPDAILMSLLPCSGAAQYAALGSLRGGGSWLVIVGVTALLNARHVLYGVSLAPALAGLRTRERAAMAHVLTDEAFALGAAHFARIGRVDRAGYWIAALVSVYVPWNVGTAIGAIAGGVVPDLSAIGIDAVFPATMAALAVAALRATQRTPGDASRARPARAAVALATNAALHPGGDHAPAAQVGATIVATVACAALVARGRSLVIGLVAAMAIVAVARSIGAT